MKVQVTLKRISATYRGWTQAEVGCHWTRGGYYASSVSTPDGKLRGYDLRYQNRVLGEFIDWAEVERLADRRVSDRRQKV